MSISSSSSCFHTIVEKRLWLHQVGIFEFIPTPAAAAGARRGNGGDCLFQCISQILTTSSSSSSLPIAASNKFHPSQIRRSVVQHLTNQQRVFRQKKKSASSSSGIRNYWRTKLESEQMLNLLVSGQLLVRDQQQETDHDLIDLITDLDLEQEYVARMSQPDEHGSLHELLAAADLYSFHINYIRQASKVHGLYIIASCCTSNTIGCCSPCTCTVPTDKPNYIFYFKKYSCGRGHWQLLRPIVLFQIPVPVHRKIYGQCYLYRRQLQRSSESQSQLEEKDLICSEITNLCYYNHENTFEGQLDSIASLLLHNAKKTNRLPPAPEEDRVWSPTATASSHDLIGDAASSYSSSMNHRSALRSRQNDDPDSPPAAVNPENENGENFRNEGVSQSSYKENYSSKHANSKWRSTSLILTIIQILHHLLHHCCRISYRKLINCCRRL